MGEGKPVTTWTCDRCGRQENTTDRHQPKPTKSNAWISVYIVTPPRRSPCDERIAWLLCPDCDKSIADWRDRPAAVKERTD